MGKRWPPAGRQRLTFPRNKKLPRDLEDGMAPKYTSSHRRPQLLWKFFGNSSAPLQDSGPGNGSA